MIYKTIEEMQMEIMLANKKKKKLSVKKIKKNNDGESPRENSKIKDRNVDVVDKKRKKEIDDATTFSNIAVKINVSINDLREISKLPDGSGHNTAELAKDLKHNKGKGIKQKIKNLHEGKEEELKETFVNQLHLKSHHVTGSFVKDLQERESGPKNHNH